MLTHVNAHSCLEFWKRQVCVIEQLYVAADNQLAKIRGLNMASSHSFVIFFHHTLASSHPHGRTAAKDRLQSAQSLKCRMRRMNGWI